MYRNGSTVFNTLTGPSNLIDKTCFFYIKGRKNHIQGALIFIFVTKHRTVLEGCSQFTYIYIGHGQHNLYIIRSQQWLVSKETESQWLMDEPAFFTEKWNEEMKAGKKTWFSKGKGDPVIHNYSNLSSCYSQLASCQMIYNLGFPPKNRWRKVLS